MIGGGGDDESGGVVARLGGMNGGGFMEGGGGLDPGGVQWRDVVSDGILHAVFESFWRGISLLNRGPGRTGSSSESESDSLSPRSSVFLPAEGVYSHRGIFSWSSFCFTTSFVRSSSCSSVTANATGPGS